MDQIVELSQMLEARERRAQRQRELLERYGLPLVSFTMNIAGPVKNSPSIRRGFSIGRDLLLGQLQRVKAPLVCREEIDEVTGCEGFYVVDLSGAALKELTVEIEEHTRLGRLFDMDVISPSGEKLERAIARRCMICGRPAQECARSRMHTVTELQRKTHEILSSALDRHDAETVAALAVRALLFEVAVTPKPGLVDRDGNGSHQDMDFYTFLSSASSLFPYFSECFMIGRQTAADPAPFTFSRLRIPGKFAEGKMLRATGSINTHKGAIFTLGIISGALGRIPREKWHSPADVLKQAADMTCDVEKELSGLTEESARTAGQRIFVRCGVTGVRGQAAAGFPTVLHHGLPVLENGLTQGKTRDEAGAAALLAILSCTTDTNMISRGGIEIENEKRIQLSALLNDTPYPDRETLLALDREYTEENLSPGGSADLLALCWLLHFLKEESQSGVHNFTDLSE